MVCVTYLSDYEERAWRVVADKDLNDLLQQARKYGNWLIDVRTYSYSKWWWLNEKTYTKYTLYWETSSPEYQIMNLATESGKGSVFTNSSRADVLNYLIGYVNGHQQAEMKQK